ncbi:hypothetical protein VULLAG_LOCUS16312 [Vulpes lagopus]
MTGPHPPRAPLPRPRGRRARTRGSSARPPRAHLHDKARVYLARHRRARLCPGSDDRAAAPPPRARPSRPSELGRGWARGAGRGAAPEGFPEAAAARARAGPGGAGRCGGDAPGAGGPARPRTRAAPSPARAPAPGRRGPGLRRQ